MIQGIRRNIEAIARFLRTPTLSRSVIGLLSLAIVLLLAVNVATFVMIRRTAHFNDEVERAQELRLTSKDILAYSVDAETAQRGYLLTNRAEYLQPYETAVQRLPSAVAALRELTAGDPDLEPRLDHLLELQQQRLDIIDRTILMARAGRIGEAVQVLRDDQGRRLMDAMRVEIAAIDEVQATRLQFRTRRVEWASGATLFVNGMAGALILVLAGISAWLIRRYVGDVEHAARELDRLNAGLEDEVRSRTGALVRANEEIQRFAYIVSHDLRSPLVNVMGYTAELEQAGKIIDKAIAAAEKKRKIDADVITAVREDIPEAIGFIRASTAKMDRLINAILKLSREGRRTMVPEVLDMTPMVQSVADGVRHQTEAAGAEITVHPLPRLDSDRLSIEQIFGNLIDNAVKYLDEARRGRIEVTGVDLADDWVEYRITDNGRGVSERDHERIFELFRRSGRQDRPGEGLGLAFVRNSVRRLGGEIALESELGKGSTFLLKFPKRLVLSEAGDAV